MNGFPLRGRVQPSRAAKRPDGDDEGEGAEPPLLWSARPHLRWEAAFPNPRLPSESEGNEGATDEWISPSGEGSAVPGGLMGGR